MEATVILDITPGVAAKGIAPTPQDWNNDGVPFSGFFVSLPPSDDIVFIPLNDPDNYCWGFTRASFDVDAAGKITAWDLGVAGACWWIGITSSHGDGFLWDAQRIAANSYVPGTWTSTAVIAPEPSSILLLAVGLVSLRGFRIVLPSGCGERRWRLLSKGCRRYPSWKLTPRAVRICPANCCARADLSNTNVQLIKKVSLRISGFPE